MFSLIETSQRSPETIAYKELDSEIIQDLPLSDENLSRFGMTKWSHNINRSERFTRKSSPAETSKLNGFLQGSIETERKIAITPMSRPLDGFEAIAIQTIPRGSCIIYSGQLTTPSDDPHDKYVAFAFRIGDREEYGNCITAKQCGNAARFFNHAFDADTLKEEVFFTESSQQTEAVTANFYPDYYKTEHNGYICLLMATRDIYPGERLCWDYGRSYAETIGNLSLFNKHNGAAINPELYRWKKVNLKIGDCDINVTEHINNNFCSILLGSEFNKNYDTIISPDYLLQMMNDQPAVSAMIITHPLPMIETPLIKRLKKYSELEQQLKSSLNVLLGDLYTENKWQTNKQGMRVDLTLSAWPELFKFIWRTAGEQRYIEAIYHALCAAGLERNRDFICNESQLLIFQDSLFKKIPSTTQYYRDIFKNIYQPELP